MSLTNEYDKNLEPDETNLTVVNIREEPDLNYKLDVLSPKSLLL